jgi:hemerythrin superfamily protein
MTETQSQDLIDVLVTDHREVDQLFADLEAATNDPQRRRRLADVVIAELIRHSVAEEMYLYPTVRAALPDGDRVADHEIAEHADAERTMRDIEDLEFDDARLDAALTELMALIRHHVHEEETDLFPRLREACNAQELRELGAKVETAKKLAPTRPHPAAPDRPPLNKLLAPGAGLVDRLRDALSGRPTSRSEL